MAEVWVPCYGRHRWETDPATGRTVCQRCGRALNTLNPRSTADTQLALQVDS